MKYYSNIRSAGMGQQSLNTLQMISLLLCSYYSPVSFADWIVNPNIQNEAAGATIVAHNTNQQDYTLEVYKDADQAIRVRFSLQAGLTRLQSGVCPTYQVDQDSPDNLSYNGEPCVATDTWAEYLFGSVQGSRVISPALFGIMNGNNITFRFILANGDYRETQFSLAGSKRSLSNVVGETITVLSR